MNINEIAELAGVSRATVSRYLNNGYVSNEKRDRISKVIEETGYMPSAQAQMLRTKKTGFIGVIIPKINSDSISRMVEGISDILSDKGYQLLLANTSNNSKEEIQYLKKLSSNHVDGIILIGTVLSKEHYKVMKQISVPLVVLAQHTSDYSCVYYDDYGAAKALTSEVMKNGSRPAYIGAVADDEAVGQQRLNGFLDACKDKGIMVDDDHCTNGAFRIENGFDSAEKLMKLDPTIDTMICATDKIAIGAMAYLKQAGYKVPEDVQIAGFGDSLISKVCDPKMSSIHFFYKTSGEEAANMLVDAIENSQSVRKEVKMGYQIVKVGSLR
ncbi:MAG: LacI family DNA-binding transcriptional regulator [Lachnospiraceae bacterium]|nr:LacI family DNA-binding transcriptional regulator [Lachnospiraceae bacterium]